MAQTESDAPNIAIFADFENVALGVRDANIEALDIDVVIERLLDKGKIVVKKAYADWDRYKSHKRTMHEAAFELVEIPHVSFSGKNSADIRMVVDALDLCYTKSHIDIFVILSGDSDFSPLVSKLRENDKMVIGVGVKNSTSDLLVDNCDEFIYYDDLVRSVRKVKNSEARREPTRAKPQAKAPNAATRTYAKPDQLAKADQHAKTEARQDVRPEQKPETRAEQKCDTKQDVKQDAKQDVKQDTKQDVKQDAVVASQTAVESEAKSIEERREDAIEMVLDVVESLFRDRDDNLWGSMVKQTLKRKKPNFSESYHGYRTFNELLEDAQRRGLLETQKDVRSGGYLILSFGPNA